MKRIINDTNKPKSVIIDGKLHYDFKTLCKGKNMKIGAVLEDLIRLYVKQQKMLQKMMDEIKEKELQHY
ncbi:MAG: hypothetical protein ACOC33_01105 [bacterium]